LEPSAAEEEVPSTGSAQKQFKEERMRRTPLLFTLIVFVCGFLFLPSATAQTINGSISGLVTDANGAAIAGATVTATNTGNGQSRDVTTNEEGLYRISSLAIGSYSVKIEKSGFGSVTEDTRVSAGADTAVNFKLSAGAVTAQVQVTDTGAMLETTQSQVTKTIDQQKILELPGRNAQAGLALLNPGVLPNQNGRPGSGFAVNGNRTRSNNFTIDGANNNDQSLSIPRQNLPPEDLGEFQIITNTFSAEYGRNAGSYVNQITKSGTNEFHGIGFYAWDGNGLDSLTTGQQRNFNAQRLANPTLSDKDILRRVRSVTVRNTYGFNVGGPVVKNHTFFFGSMDFQDFRQTVGVATRPALTSAARATLQANAALFAPGAVNYLLNRFPVANDPTSNGSLTIRNFNDPSAGCQANPSTCPVLFSLPFQTSNRFLGQGALPYGTDFDRYLAKINTKINDKDQLSFRYLLDQFNDPGTPASLEGEELGQVSRNQSFTINDVYMLTSSFINEFRFTYSRRKISFPENYGTAFDVGGAPANTAFTLGNINFPQYRTDNVFELTENMAYTTGNHTFKWGWNALRYQLNNFFAPNSLGSVSYPDLNNMLFDRSATIQKYNGDASLNAITYEHGFFVQDDWRFNSDITLNLGLRYEYVTTPFGYFSNAKSDINNFGPSLGVAWNPKNIADGRFVARAGFRVAYDQIFQNVLLNVSRNYPRGYSFGQTISGARPYNGLPAIALLSPQQAVTTFGLDPRTFEYRLFSPDKRISQPRSMQWTLGVQYQLGKDYVAKAEYITTKGNSLVREYESNWGFFAPIGAFAPCTAAQLTANPACNNRGRLDPTRGSIVIGDGIAESIYHAGQFTLEKRFGKIPFFGMDLGSSTFNANYTYSAFLSNGDDILGGGSGLNRTVPSDPRSFTGDYGRSGFDQPHRFVASAVWVSPEVFRSNGILNRIFSGWEISSITTYATGTPYSVISSPNTLGIIPSGQLSTVQSTHRVGVNPSGIPGTFTTATAAGVLANPNAYYIVYPTNSGLGNTLGANTLRTGGTQNTDMAVVKNIRTFGENQRLQLRAEIFNLFNHRNFTSIPSRVLAANSDPTLFLNLGRVNSITGRNFLFGLRYFF
jgi:outer membrane receptor protein involved in Fe transport